MLAGSYHKEINIKKTFLSAVRTRTGRAETGGAATVVATGVATIAAAAAAITSPKNHNTKNNFKGSTVLFSFHQRNVALQTIEIGSPISALESSRFNLSLATSSEVFLPPPLGESLSYFQRSCFLLYPKKFKDYLNTWANNVMF